MVYYWVVTTVCNTGSWPNTATTKEFLRLFYSLECLFHIWLIGDTGWVLVGATGLVFVFRLFKKSRPLFIWQGSGFHKERLILRSQYFCNPQQFRGMWLRRVIQIRFWDTGLTLLFFFICLQYHRSWLRVNKEENS